MAQLASHFNFGIWNVCLSNTMYTVSYYKRKIMSMTRHFLIDCVLKCSRFSTHFSSSPFIPFHSMPFKSNLINHSLSISLACVCVCVRAETHAACSRSIYILWFASIELMRAHTLRSPIQFRLNEREQNFPCGRTRNCLWIYCTNTKYENNNNSHVQHIIVWNGPSEMQTFTAATSRLL